MLIAYNIYDIKKESETMAEITNEMTKNITMSNQIKVDGVIVKGQTAVINQTSNDISLTDYTSNMELYKENKEAIREKMAEFEDTVFQEQENLVEQLSLEK